MDYNIFRAWTNEMIAKVTSPELAQDVPGAEALISRHLEHFAEIKSREEAFAHFNNTGQILIKQVNFFLYYIIFQCIFSLIFIFYNIICLFIFFRVISYLKISKKKLGFLTKGKFF